MAVDIPLELDKTSHPLPPRTPGNSEWIHQEKIHHSLLPWWQAHTPPRTFWDDLQFPIVIWPESWKSKLIPDTSVWITWVKWFSSPSTPELIESVLSWGNWATEEANREASIAAIKMEWHKCLRQVITGETYFQNLPNLIIQNPTLWAFVIQYPHIWKNIALRWWQRTEMLGYITNLENIEPRQKDKDSPVEYSRQWFDQLYFIILQLIRQAHEKLP